MGEKAPSRWRLQQDEGNRDLPRTRGKKRPTAAEAPAAGDASPRASQEGEEENGDNDFVPEKQMRKESPAEPARAQGDQGQGRGRGSGRDRDRSNKSKSKSKGNSKPKPKDKGKSMNVSKSVVTGSKKARNQSGGFGKQQGAGAGHKEQMKKVQAELTRSAQGDNSEIFEKLQGFGAFGALDKGSVLGAGNVQPPSGANSSREQKVLCFSMSSSLN